MKPSAKNLIMAIGLGVLGLALGIGGVVVGELDDAPGGSLMGIVLMIVLMVLAVRTARRKT